MSTEGCGITGGKIRNVRDDGATASDSACSRLRTAVISGGLGGRLGLELFLQQPEDDLGERWYYF